MSPSFARAVPLLVLVVSGCGSQATGARYSGPVLDATAHLDVSGPDAQPLSGVRICADGRGDIPCVTTGADGSADLALPDDNDFVLQYTKSGFIPALRACRTSSGSALPDVGPWFMQPIGWYAHGAAHLAGTLDLDAKGVVIVQANAEAHAHFAIDPRRAGVVGPMFFKLADGALDLCLDGECLPMAAWADVPPGAYHGLAASFGRNCSPAAFACTDGTPGCARVEARAGFVSWAPIACKQQEIPRGANTPGQ